jgi:hypothetical protein
MKAVSVGGIMLQLGTSLPTKSDIRRVMKDAGMKNVKISAVTWAGSGLGRVPVSEAVGACVYKDQLICWHMENMKFN